jgi:hypothetical protein
MFTMAPSDLTSLSPLWVGNDRIPGPQISENIDTLRNILDLVVEDWRGAVEPYQRESDKNPKGYLAPGWFLELQPAFLKCLFSYALFTIALKEAYEKVYSQLDRANRELNLRVKKPKKPNEIAVISKLLMIRNCSIAHFPSDRASQIDAFAAMSWTPMAINWSSGKVDIEQLTFNPGRWRAKNQVTGEEVESQDLEVRGLVSPHRDCSRYLDSYGKACEDYLRALHKAQSNQPVE